MQRNTKYRAVSGPYDALKNGHHAIYHEASWNKYMEGRGDRSSFFDFFLKKPRRGPLVVPNVQNGFLSTNYIWCGPFTLILASLDPERKREYGQMQKARVSLQKKCAANLIYLLETLTHWFDPHLSLLSNKRIFMQMSKRSNWCIYVKFIPADTTSFQRCLNVLTLERRCLNVELKRSRVLTCTCTVYILYKYMLSCIYRAPASIFKLHVSPL